MDPALLQKIALTVASARSLDETLRVVVRGLSSLPDAALARIWLLKPGDICGSCPMRSDCPDQRRCLHLAASAGSSRDDPSVAWSGLDGAFARFPLGIRKVGRIGASQRPELLRELDGEDWMASPEWARRERIRSFAGQPLVFDGETLGVLAVFSRAELTADHLGWLRTFADQAAVAIANANAFDEIALLKRQLELERDYLREENREVGAFGDIIGRSDALQVPLQHIERVAPTDASVLLLGESGTGKELFARAIHEHSDRRDKAMVRVNCAAVPKELFESEFFGHKKGAFTGASADRAGRFEIADGGTLFLDEVGEIPLDLQSKLLRVLQEGQFERIGEATTRTVDVRVVAATNRDLEEEAAQGRFREDLYYRLSVFPIRLPPLRERVGDIRALAEHFIDRAARRFRRPRPRLDDAQLRALESYPWPGNIRELQSVIERAIILADGEHLPIDSALPSTLGKAKGVRGGDGIMKDAQVRAMERDNIIAALEKAAWKVSGQGGAAELIGLKTSTLNSRIRALEIQRPGS